MLKYILLFLSFYSLLSAQAPNFNWENRLIAKSIDCEWISGLKILETNDKYSYVIATGQNYKKGWMTKINMNGDIEWSQGRPDIEGVVTPEVTLNSNKILLSENDDYYLFNGLIEKPSLFFSTALVYQFGFLKKDLTTLENSKSNNPDDLIFSPVILKRNPFTENLISVSYVSQDSALIPIIYESNNYSILQRVVYPDTIRGKVMSYIPTDLSVTANQEFLLVFGNSMLPDPSLTNFYIQILNKDFKSKRIVKIETSHLLKEYSPIPVKIEKVNEKIYIFGNFRNFSKSDFKPFVIILDNNFKIEKFKIIESLASARTATINPDGSVVLAGQFLPTSTKPDRDYFLAEIDASIDKVVEYRWGNEKDNTLNYIIDIGSAYIATGADGDDMYISSIKKTVLSIVEDLPKESLKLIPNPSFENIRVEGLDDFDFKLELFIYDIFGKIVLTSNRTNDLYIGDLTNGVYTVKINYNGNTEFLKFVKSN